MAEQIRLYISSRWLTVWINMIQTIFHGVYIQLKQLEQNRT